MRGSRAECDLPSCWCVYGPVGASSKSLFVVTAAFVAAVTHNERAREVVLVASDKRQSALSNIGWEVRSTLSMVVSK